MTGSEVQRLRGAILTLLDQRADDASICPSDAARAAGDDDWRRLMEPARQAAGELASEGVVEVTQGGRVVDVGTARGPVRIRKAR